MTTTLTPVEQLDGDQRALLSWHPDQGNMRAVAAAGSGKTTALCWLGVKLLLVDQISPDDVALMTFSRSAADTFRSRLESTVSLEKMNRLTLGTFHSIAVRELQRIEPDKWKYSKCVDLPQASREANIPSTAILWRTALNYGTMPGTGEASLRLAKAVPAEYAQIVDCARADRAASLKTLESRATPGLVDAWQLICRSKASLGAWDFADALEAWAKHLEAGHPGLRRFRVVLVDEAQDNSRIQLDIAQLLRRPDNGALVLIGDLRQAIHVWRGAFPAIFQHADTMLNAVTKELRYNYRSSPEIVSLANVYTEGKKWNLGEPAIPVRSESGTVRFLPPVFSFMDMADAFVSEIQPLLDQKRQVAFLARTRGQVGAFELALLRRQVPYVALGGSSVLGSFVAESFLSYLSAAMLGSPGPASKVVNRPNRYIANTVVAQVEKIVATSREQLVDELLALAKRKDTPKAASRGLVDFAQLIDVLGTMQWNKLVARVVSLLKGDTPSREAVHERDDAGVLDALGSYALQFGSFIDFQAEVLRALAGHRPEEAVLTVSTFHRSKGLEWDAVCMDATQGYLPHVRSVGNPNATEEEERLFYVSATRAKTQLLIGYLDTKNAQNATSNSPVGGLSKLATALYKAQIAS